MPVLPFGTFPVGVVAGVVDSIALRSAPGKLFMISGPSGSGKGTLIRMLQQDPEMADRFVHPPDIKTRPPRPGELQDPTWRFMSQAAFQQLQAEDKLFQWAEYNQTYYGTVLEDILDLLNQGKHLFFEMTAPAALEIKRMYPEKVFTLFVLPAQGDEAHCLSVLRQRLLARGTESDADRECRLAEAKNELALAFRFDACMVNEANQVEEAYQALKKHLNRVVEKESVVLV